MTASRKSVRRKLTELILGTCFCVLAVVLAGLVGYEVHSYRQATARSVSTLAEIIAENSGTALLFDDQKLAEEILGGVHAEGEIATAALYDKYGHLYARYPKNLPLTAFPSGPGSDGVKLGLNDLSVWKPVFQGTTRVGTIHFKGDLQGTYQRLGVFATVLVGVAAVSIVIALVLSNYLQRRFSQPLATLASSARQIRSEKNYAIRAVKASEDEIGDLTDDFNAMLDEIQANSRALFEQEEKLRTLADNMAQLAWIVDENGEFLWYNKRWHDYTGLDFTASKEHGWETIHPDFTDKITSSLRAAFAAGTEWEETFPLRGRDNRFRWFLSHAIPIRNADAKVLRWFGTNTDVSELRKVQLDLKEARDEAVAASTAKDEFLAKLSHELRTPLNPVLLLVSDEERNQTLPADIRADFAIIRNNVELEAHLIDDLLDLTAIARGKLVLHRRIVPLNEVVREAISKVAADAEARAITIDPQCTASDPSVECDPVRLQQVIWNVLKNAVKFSPARDTIRVRTALSLDPPAVSITITDHGIGMSPGEIEKIFDAFAQGDHAAGGGSHRFGGLGLGLAIARRVVELHGGTIAARSDGPHQGSTFVITLPAAIAEMPVMPASLPVNSKEPWLTEGGGRVVLLVEDHEPTSLSLERLLRRRRFKVIRASSIEAARTAFLSSSVDILVSDIGLPDGNGYALMQDFRVRYDVVGIAMTGYGMETDVKLALDAGFQIHLTKPIRVDSLDQALAAAIAMCGTVKSK